VHAMIGRIIVELLAVAFAVLVLVIGPDKGE
jgi:hypothetical protein